MQQVKIGIVFEKFTKLIVLDHILNKLDNGTILNIGFRGAFDHEDKSAKISNIKFKPLARSDLVITRYRKNGNVGVVPVQLKKGGVAKIARGEPMGSLPLIHMPRIEISHDQSVRTAENLARKYAGSSCDRNRQTQTTILQGLELMAA